MLVFLFSIFCMAQEFSAWVERLPKEQTTQPPYRYLSTMYRQLHMLQQEKPGVIEPFVVGYTARKIPIWGFRMQEPAREIRAKVLVFAGLHPLEWISNETAMEVIESLYRHPIDHVEVTVIPCVNIDRRKLAEQELLEGKKKYRRSNAKGVDLNRDYVANRTSNEIWKHVIPQYYTVSPTPLSQPESKALDQLAAQESFDAVVSLHSFGGYIFYPWAGRWDQIPDVERHHYVASEMARAQQDPFPYKAMQLARWGFPFRTLGTEVDHFYAQYGSLSFLIELTRSGLFPLSRKSFEHPFRWYNPKKPQKDMRRGRDSVLALARLLGMERWGLDN